MAQTTIKKTVNMVGYDAEEEYDGVREWANEMVEFDMLEKEEETNREVKLVYDAGEGEHNINISSWDFTDEGLELLKQEASGNRVRVKDETTTREIFARTLNSAGRDVCNQITSGIDDGFTAGGVQFDKVSRYHGKRWESEEGDSIWIKNGTFDERRILSKEKNRESDDLYETMSEVNSVKFNIEMESTSDDVIQALSQGIIPRLHKALSGVTAVGKVRYMACEKQTVEEGECYDI